MNPTEQKQLFEALRGPIIYEDHCVNQLMDEIAAYDVCVISGVVQEIERNAEARGRFAQLLELTYEHWLKRTARAA